MASVQINGSVPDGWKEELERLARLYSLEEDKTLTYLDLIRSPIQEQRGT